jgi:hypothetical protein
VWSGQFGKLQKVQKDPNELKRKLQIHIHKNTVLRIRDVYPGSEFFPSRIRIKEFKHRIGIPDPDPDFLPIPVPGSREGSKRHRIPDPEH